jgi:hypothetical protein
MGQQSFGEESLLSKLVLTQWTGVERLSHEKKGSFSYIPFWAGYRRGGAACPIHGHILLHWLFQPLERGDPSLVSPQMLVDIPQILFYCCCFTAVLIIYHYLPHCLSFFPFSPCLPATCPPLVLRPTSGSKSITWSRGLYSIMVQKDCTQH